MVNQSSDLILATTIRTVSILNLSLLREMLRFVSGVKWASALHPSSGL